MEKNEILELEKNSPNKFKNPKELLEIGRKLFTDMTFPTILGPKEIHSDIRYLEPNDISDKLSVESYMTGLEELTKHKYYGEDILKVEPFLIFDRIEEIKYTSQGHVLALFGVGQGQYSFYLHISYYHASRDRGIKYIAKCQKEISVLEKIMDKYMCPNKNQFNVII